MDANQIIIIGIVILSGIILVFGIYFLIVYIHNKNHEKKMDTIFNPKNLVEEESLMNVMDQKKNIEFLEEKKDEQRVFLNDDASAEVVTSDVLKQEKQVNPFGVDLTMHTKDNQPITIPDENSSQNRFIK